MKEWIISVISAVALITVISLLLPEGRLSKFVKPFISAVLILVIVSPIASAGGFSEYFSEGTADISVNDDFLDYINSAKIDVYRKNCVKIAQNLGINDCDAEIEYLMNDDKSVQIVGVKIYLQNAVITSEDEHIVIMQRLKNALSEYLSIDQTDVVINGE